MECSEGERQYGEGSKRELVPQRHRNSVVKENGTIPLALCWFSGAVRRSDRTPSYTLKGLVPKGMSRRGGRTLRSAASKFRRN